MIRKRFSVLLVLLLSISIIGCGSASVKNDSANANAADVVTSNSTKVESETVSEVSMPETKTDSIDSATSTASVDEAQAEVNYTGSFYTLPVGVKGEEWSEARLDEYLKDCKPYQDNFTYDKYSNLEVDFDQILEDFDFEYIGIVEEDGPYSVYWRQKGNVKYVLLYFSVGVIYVYTESSACAAKVALYLDQTKANAFLMTDDFGENHYPEAIQAAYAKGVVASLYAIVKMDNLDCGKLPYPGWYALEYPINGTSFGLKKGLDFVNDCVVNREYVYK